MTGLWPPSRERVYAAAAVERVSREQIAAGAGVEPAYVARLIEAGILEPDGAGLLSERDVRRVRIVQTLEGAGLPLAGLGEAVRSGVISLAFIDSPSYDRWGSFSETTFQSLSDETGVPVELLMVIREAMGSAAPRPDDRVRVDEMLVVPHGSAAASTGLPSRGDRTGAAGLRRWLAAHCRDGIGLVVQRGHDADHALRERSRGPVDGCHQRGLRGAVACPCQGGRCRPSWPSTTASRPTPGSATSSKASKPLWRAPVIHSRLERVPAMCFFDLTGYTRLTEERGDEVAADLARSLASLVQKNSVQYGGKAVKFLGDGVMFHFPEPGKGVLAALDMVEAAVSVGLPPAHVGLHAGPVLFQEGDYFGRTVNISARIADYARPGEVLVSQEVVDASGDPRGITPRSGRSS